MVVRTMLILRSLTQCCVVSCFCELSLNKFSQVNSIYMADYVLFVFIVANKGLHDFSVKKVFMLIFFLMGQYIVSVFTGYSHICTVDSQEQSSWCFVSVWVAHF